MTSLRTLILSLLTAMLAAMAVLVVDVSDAYAQSRNCSRLIATLDALDRNSDFRSSGRASSDARDLQRQLQRLESRYVRDGCNADAKAGRRLSSQCRSLAREITQGRDRLKRLNEQSSAGDAIERQREAVLQEIARFGCHDPSSSATLRRDSNRGNIFDQLFDALSGDFDGGGGLREEEWDPFGNYHTVRTLCVRKSDGYYWPISYSTLTDYVSNDLEQCTAQCPGIDVDLYYYDNPGQEVEQMVNMYGEPYKSLPNAFKFQTEFDKASSCKTASNYGSISIIDAGNGQSRAMITFEGQTFPLPVRDPRRQSAVVVATAVDTTVYVDVPLPRRRPAAPGEEPKVVPVAPSASNPTARVVQFGDKRVRIVGPDTPYARAVAEGT